MTNKESGLWQLLICKYAGNRHIIEHVNVPSLVRRAEMENSFIEGLALDHFPLQESLERVREYAARVTDFPP